MNLSLRSTQNRSQMLVWLMIAVGAIFVIRLFYLQVIRHVNITEHLRGQLAFWIHALVLFLHANTWQLFLL